MSVTNPSRILVVDDDIAFLKITEELLRPHYQVSLAKSGDQAVRFLEKGGRPDLILLDIHMPDMDGFETLRQLRDAVAAAETPVIYLTGLDDPEVEVQSFCVGAVDYIKKSAGKEVLLARIAVRLVQDAACRQLSLLRKNMDNCGGINPDKLMQMERLLSKTELAVATLLAQGYTNKEIGRLLHYSPAYVKKVVSRVFDRLSIGKRGEIKRFFS